MQSNRARLKQNSYCRKWWRKNRKAWRQMCLEKYGGKCVRCRFSDSRALQFDHVRSDGKMERHKMMTVGYLKGIFNDTTGKYQLLCANCNRIKMVELDERNLPFLNSSASAQQTLLL